jgi:hypothetical protein
MLSNKRKLAAYGQPRRMPNRTPFLDQASESLTVLQPRLGENPLSPTEPSALSTTYILLSLAQIVKQNPCSRSHVRLGAAPPRRAPASDAHTPAAPTQCTPMQRSARTRAAKNARPSSNRAGNPSTAGAASWHSPRALRHVNAPR